MSEARTPVTTLFELDQLDLAEMAEGYRSGMDGEPEPGNNRSKSFWHGWRNGAGDKAGRADGPQRELVRAVKGRA